LPGGAFGHKAILGLIGQKLSFSHKGDYFTQQPGADVGNISKV
jgi:hypothetical protein